MRHRRGQLVRALLAMATLWSIAVAVAHTERSQHDGPSMREFWEEPTDLAARDLFSGPFGAASAPDGTSTFVFQTRKTTGTNPGMVVTDSTGREWHVKQGREARPEVVVSRILSAVGYHQPPVYFLPSFRVASGEGVSAQSAGRFRLTAKQLKHSGYWAWEKNPFVGTVPHQGLLVILVLLNSADLKNVNNALYEVAGSGFAPRWFVVRDLGTSLGEDGRFSPNGDNLKSFERHGFITGVVKGRVRFDYGGVHRGVLAGITPTDVGWACRLLSRLSDHQWLEAFRAGGYSTPTATAFIRRIHQKIDQGLNVGS